MDYKIVCLTLTFCCLSSAFEQNVYEFQANTSVVNPIDRSIHSKWMLHGKLILQNHNKKIFAKFEDIRTNAYNGNETDMPYSEPLDVPNESNVLLKPFVIHYNNALVQSISVEPDDVLWSVNIKRAVASIFQLNTEQATTKDEYVDELSLYGNCKTRYERIKSDDQDKIIKSFNDDDCNGIAIKSFKTAQPVQFADAQRKPFTRNVTRNYILNLSGDIKCISSDSKIIINKVNDDESPIRNGTKDHTDQYENWIVQKHEFKLLTSTNIDKPIDVSKVTIVKNIKFEVDEDLTQGRRKNVENLSKSELISMWLLEANKTIEMLKQKADNIPKDNIYEDQFQVLRRIATKFDVKLFHDLHSEIFKINDTELTSIWVSILPVVGSLDSVHFIKEICQEVSDFTATLLLSQFPSYVKNYSTELLKDMEPLMSMHKANVTVMSSGILSFSTLVSKTYELNNCDKETYSKYVNIYSKLFAETDDLRLRIAYLHGLHNLQADVIVFVPIVRNNTENFNVRILAINAVKDQLKLQLDKAYDMFWPMVKDITLRLEIRIAAFDVILNSHMTEEQFVTMYEFLNSKIGSDYEYIYNYFYTTFQSVQNHTKCPDYMVRFIHLKPLRKPLAKPVTTGNYRSAVIDRYARYGTHFELKYIEDPLTNYPSAIYLKFNRFGLGMNYGSFAIRVQMDNIFSTLLFDDLSSGVSDQKTFKELTDIVEKHNLLSSEVQSVSMHITLYSDEKAIFDVYFEKDAKPYKNFGMELLQVMQKSLSIHYPVSNVDFSVSDFGTPISSEIEVNFAEIHDINWLRAIRRGPNRDFSFDLRFIDASNVSVKSYNPVDDVFFGSSNYYRNDMTFKSKFSMTEVYLTFPIVWKGDENPEYFRSTVDEISMNYVEHEDYLHKHCTDCKHLLNVYEDPDYAEFMMDDQGLFMAALTDIIQAPAYKCLESGDYTAGQYLVPTTYDNFDSNYYDHSIVIPFLWHMLSREYNLFDAKHATQSATFSCKSPYAGAGKIKNEISLLFERRDKYIAFTSTNVETNDVFQIFNASSLYIDNDNEQLVQANVSYRFNNKSVLVCMHSNITYPKAFKDPFSMVPPKPAHFAFSLLYGAYNESTQGCPLDSYMNVTATLSTSDEQIEEFNNLKSWYKECKAQSEGLTYFAPTEECYKASRRISTYRNFSASIIGHPKIEHSLAQIISLNTSDALHETNWKLIALINEESLNATLRTFLYNDNKWDETNEIFYTKELPIGLPEYVMRSPNYDHIAPKTIDLPFDRYCAITPNIVKTFGGRIIENYESKFNIDKLGYIERSNVSGNGLVITRVNEHEPKIAFKLWSGSSEPFTLEVYPEETKLNVTVNEEQVHEKAIYDYYPAIIQIEDDHLHITTLLSEVYYYKDYVMVKMSSQHVKYFAGLCSFEENNISV